MLSPRRRRDLLCPDRQGDAVRLTGRPLSPLPRPRPRTDTASAAPWSTLALKEHLLVVSHSKMPPTSGPSIGPRTLASAVASPGAGVGAMMEVDEGVSAEAGASTGAMAGAAAGASAGASMCARASPHRWNWQSILQTWRTRFSHVLLFAVKRVVDPLHGPIRGPREIASAILKAIPTRNRKAIAAQLFLVSGSQNQVGMVRVPKMRHRGFFFFSRPTGLLQRSDNVM